MININHVQKSRFFISIAASLCLASTGVLASDSLASAFSQGKVNGNVQAWYINNSFNAGSGTAIQTKNGGSANPSARGEYAVGGILGYVTKPYYGINAGAAFISSNLLGQNPNAGNSGNNYALTSSSVTPSLNFNANVLSEGYVNGNYAKTNIKIGNQKLDTPLMNFAEGARIFYRTYRGAVLTNKDLPDTTLSAAYINGMQSFFTALYSGTVPGSLGATNNSQASLNLGFQGMSQIAFGTNSNLIAGGAHNPVWYLSAVNESVKNLKAQVWFYQAQNMMNSWWLQADYKYGFSKEFGVFGAAQYLNQQGIGTTQNSFKNGAGWSGNTNALYMYCNGQNANAKNSVCSAGISNSYIGIKAGIKYENAKAYIAFSDTALNNNAAMDGSLIMPWGGFQQNLFTSFMMANPTAAGTKATLYKVEYDFDGVLKGLYAGAGYALYAANSSANDAFTTLNPYGTNSSVSVGSMGYNAMFGELRYNLSKNLMLRWQLENDSMLGQVSGYPKGAMESRLMGIYKF